MKYMLLFLLSTSIIAACNNNVQPVQKNTTVAEDSVRATMQLIAKDVSANGPVAWLNWFENTPAFFMSSDGSVAFKDYSAAEHFIKDTLTKAIKNIQLQWSNVRVDILADSVAAVGADFHEDMTTADGKTVPEDGYFTAVAEKTAKSWLLRNLHWSTKHQ